MNVRAPALQRGERCTQGTVLLETGGLLIAQGLETTVPIWKIKSILRLELCFMILCFSCQK